MPTVRELITKVSIGGDALNALGGIDGKVEKLKRAFGNLQQVVAAVRKVFFDWVAEVATAGDEIAKAAKNIGVTAEELQQLAFAAEISGANMRDVQVAIQRMGKGLNDARRLGTGPFADSVKQLGLDMEDFQGLDPVETFTKLAQELSLVEDASTKAALAQDFFGRGGKRLIPLIDEGAAGIEKLRAEFRGLKAGFTEDGAAAAEEFIDAQTRLKTVIDSIKIAIAVDLFPVIQKMIEAIQAWVQENRALITMRLKDFFVGVTRRAKELLPIVISLLTSFGRMAESLIKVIEGLEEFSPGLGAASIAAGALGLALGGMPGLFAAVGIAAFAAGQAIARAVLDIDGSVTKTERAIARLSAELAKAKAEFVELEGRRQDLLTEREREERERKQKLKQQQAGFGEEFLEKGTGRFGPEQQLTLEGTAIRREIGMQEIRSIEIAAARARRQAQQQGLSRTKVSQRESAARRRAAAAAKAGRGKAAQAATAAFRKTGRIGSARAAAGRAQQAAIRTGVTGERPRGGGGGGRGRGGGAATDAELLGLIDQAAPGTDVSGLGAGRNVPTAPAPIVTVTVNQFNIQMDVDAPVEVNGVPGTSAEEIAAMVETTQRQVMRDEFRAAVEQFLPTEAR